MLGGVFGRKDLRRQEPPAVLGRLNVGPTSYGYRPANFGARMANPTTPALTGLFRAGRIVPGISQINAMATWVNRGSGG